MAGLMALWRRSRVRDAVWWVRHRIDPRNRYHVIHTGLSPGYYDPDTQILHAVMGIVERFVTLTRDTVDWSYSEEHRRTWKVLTDALAFWREYQAFEKLEASLEMEHEMERRANEHLAAIMSVRDGLWYP